ncbi:MAG: deaminase [Methanogenium sp.]|jgi:dCMP deaminase
MNWHEYFFSLVEVIKAKSKDPSTKVGCVIVGSDNEVISTGFNGLPIGVKETTVRQCRPVKYLYYEHAERNAIYLASRRGIPKGARIYLEWFPCADCARAIIQVGISEVFIDGRKYDPYNPTEADTRWRESMDAAKEMFFEAGVNVLIWNFFVTSILCKDAEGKFIFKKV